SGRSSMQILFSSTNSNQFDKSLRYLKAVSVHEHRFLEKFEHNLLVLNGEKVKLLREIKSLLRLQRRMKKQEKELLISQRSKKNLLKALKKQYQSYLNLMKTVRHRSEILKEDVENVFEEVDFKSIDVAFFEQKGILPKPVLASVFQKYGLYFDEKYRYRLRHKGLFFKASLGEPVRSVYRGQVSFIGWIPGLGQTIVVDHGDNYYSVYSGIVDPKVRVKDTVSLGQELALVGYSALHQRNGLYFEIRHFSDAIDPEPWFQKPKPFSEVN
ncbi:MAG: hypothetical protein D6797_08615, partial [Bdellovibrio sp.]